MGTNCLIFAYVECEDYKNGGDKVFRVNVYSNYEDMDNEKNSLAEFYVTKKDICVFYEDENYDFENIDVSVVFNEMADVESYFENRFLCQ